MTIADRHDLIDYAEALRITGVSKVTLLNRINRDGMTVYRDGRDRRRRLLDRRDVVKLVTNTPERKGRRKIGA